MKQSDIKIGHSYTDGKGNVRKVIGRPFMFNSYYLRFRIIATAVNRKRNVNYETINYEWDITLASFARWAKSEVTEE